MATKTQKRTLTPQERKQITQQQIGIFVLTVLMVTMLAAVIHYNKYHDNQPQPLNGKLLNFKQGK